jgi:hypothetical protein
MKSKSNPIRQHSKVTILERLLSSDSSTKGKNGLSYRINRVEEAVGTS